MSLQKTGISAGPCKGKAGSDTGCCLLCRALVNNQELYMALLCKILNKFVSSAAALG